MNNGTPEIPIIAVLVIFAAVVEFSVGHWLNAFGIVLGGGVIGLAARWLYFRLKQ